MGMKLEIGADQTFHLEAPPPPVGHAECLRLGLPHHDPEGLHLPANDKAAGNAAATQAAMDMTCLWP
jgi:hypothetical protein